MISRDPELIQNRYNQRLAGLEQIAGVLERDVRDCLREFLHIDRVYFRAKSPSSFLCKATKLTEDGGDWKYGSPFEEIEDQVAGRVLVFYRADIPIVEGAILARFSRIERAYKAPSNSKEFDYESTHVVCSLTPDLLPDGWEQLDDRPTTFEIQIRTLAQHAWAEPQHGFYKVNSGLTGLSARKLYWAAASAWGLDSIWEELREELSLIDH